MHKMLNRFLNPLFGFLGFSLMLAALQSKHFAPEPGLPTGYPKSLKSSSEPIK